MRGEEVWFAATVSRWPWSAYAHTDGSRLDKNISPGVGEEDHRRRVLKETLTSQLSIKTSRWRGEGRQMLGDFLSLVLLLPSHLDNSNYIQIPRNGHFLKISISPDC